MYCIVRHVVWEGFDLNASRMTRCTLYAGGETEYLPSNNNIPWHSVSDPKYIAPHS